MKSNRMGLFLRAALAGAWFIAGSGIACRPDSRPTLRIYSRADYIKPELLDRFETQYHCRVAIDTFHSDEALQARLQAGSGKYDLLIPSSPRVKILFDQGYLQPLQHDLIPNRVNIDPDYLKIAIDQTLHHSVPYMLTFTGIAYRKSKVPDFQPTWGMFDALPLQGHTILLDDMREALGAGLKFLGYSLNSTNTHELAEARDVVIRWKKNRGRFDHNPGKAGIVSGEALLVQGHSRDILPVQIENSDIAFAIPREGTSLSSLDLVIPGSARHVELAHQFINFLHDPEAAKENTEFVQNLCPNTAAYLLLPKDIIENPALFLDPALRAKSEIIADIGDALPLYTRMWDEIKAAQ